MITSHVETPDGISWHVEVFHPIGDDLTSSQAEHIVLIPSGEGDCHNLTNLARLLSSNGSYEVLTFDMPGFSRTTAPPEAYARVKPQLLAKQIIGLLDKLDIKRASFFGCSSGGGATLALCALYPERVKCGIIHEVPLDNAPVLVNMRNTMTDDQIATACEGLFANGLIEEENDGRQKWTALGSAYHHRLKKNYVTWVKGYVDAVEVGGKEIAEVPANLQRRPVFWTVGSLNQGGLLEGRWKMNFEMAEAAGLKVDRERLKCLHFPAVSIPEETAGWIAECVGKVKD